MSNIIQEIENTIYDNEERHISGNLLQQVLLDMVNRHVFLTQAQYTQLVRTGMIDDDKIYYIYEN